MASTKGSISVTNLSKSFKLPHEKTSTLKGAFLNWVKLRKNRSIETQKVLTGINLEVRPGEFLGVVGRNGSGKSTLLKILAGIYQPSTGNVEIKGRLVPFIELGVGFNGELTGRDNVYLNGALFGFSKKEMDGMYEDIVAFAELEKFMDQKLKNYSSGMQVRLAFSIAVRAQADILLIDEVLAVGDAAFQRKCFEYFKELKANKKTVVFVTHDMNAVREYCDRAILIENSQVLRDGSANKIAQNYSQLFMSNSSHTTRRQKTGNRWGTGELWVANIMTKIKDNELTVTIDARARKELDRVIYGLHILSQDGVEITAMNNRMIQAPDIRNIKAGSKLRITWKMLNIFSDGKYSVTVTLIDNFSNTLDWLTDAANFTVQRAERSTTAVSPPVSVEHKINPRD